jgi:tetratricopeptide (TPR) repeat protein
MKASSAWSWLIAVSVGAALVAGCGGGKLPENQQNQGESANKLPEGHPPVNGQGAPMAQGQGMLGSEGPTDDNPLPLKLTGLNSVEELKRGMAATTNQEAAKLFEQGFRKTFTADNSKRDYAGAETDLKKAIELDPKYAQAYRTLGYAEFNMGFNVDAAMADYKKAIELDPNYGEAQYAIAFMYAMTDREKGAEHFKKAMELGVPDERHLGERFYQDVKVK